MSQEVSELQCGRHVLDLSSAQVMGVLNVTPDSFSDGGCFDNLSAAMVQAEAMLTAGAAVIDVGGESTRPGAHPVSEQEELDRVLPVIEGLVDNFDALVSVDTSTPAVMREAIRLGVGIVNDVRAFERSGAVEAVVNESVALCVMHMKGEPGTMQRAPSYAEVVRDISTYLSRRLEGLVDAGVSKARVLLDPGFGFGKTLAHNLALLKHLDAILALGQPVLVGMSRKTMIGEILDKPVNERLYGSIAAAVIAAQSGARIIRVHDVAQTVDAMRVVNAVNALDER